MRTVIFTLLSVMMLFMAPVPLLAQEESVTDAAATDAPDNVPEWPAQPEGSLQQRAAVQLKKFNDRSPITRSYFQQAYGYVIYPRVTRIGFGIGGAGGKGVVVEKGHIIGTSRFGQFTSGLQAGFRVFRMIIFFKEREDLEYFKLGKLEFVGQAGVSLGTLGAAADAAYNSGVAVFSRTRGGLMAEATVSGVKMTFKPLAEDLDSP